MKAFNGVCSQFLDNINDPKLRKCLLSLSMLYESHSGKNIAIDVKRVLRKYKIKGKVGFFVLNNASSNNTAIQELAKRLGKHKK